MLSTTFCSSNALEILESNYSSGIDRCLLCKNTGSGTGNVDTTALIGDHALVYDENIDGRVLSTTFCSNGIKCFCAKYYLHDLGLRDKEY